MPKPLKVPELLKRGNIEDLENLSSLIGKTFKISRKKRLGLTNTGNIAIYNEHVDSIKKNIQSLLKLHTDLQTVGVENPQEILAQNAKAILESMKTLAKTTGDPSKHKFLLTHMHGIMNAISFAQSELVRAPLRTKFAEVEKQTKSDYMQGKNGYYDAYVNKNWKNYNANYGKLFEQHVEQVHKREFEDALEKKVQETIESPLGLGLERHYQNTYLESFTNIKRQELAEKGKSFKTLTEEERREIQSEFDAKFKNWVKDQVLAQGFKQNFQGTPKESLEKAFKEKFDKKFQDQYVEHCKDRIKHHENEIRVKLDPKDPKLQLAHMRNVIQSIQQTLKGKSEGEKLAGNTCVGILDSIQKLETKISQLTKEGMTTKDAGDATLGINMIPQLFGMLLQNCESPKAKEIMAREFPALYQQVQGINLDIQEAQMKCEIGALERMRDEISGKKQPEKDIMLSEDVLEGPPIVVNPVVISGAKMEGTFAKIKEQLHAQKSEHNEEEPDKGHGFNV